MWNKCSKKPEICPNAADLYAKDHWKQNRCLMRSLIFHKYDRDEGEILPPNWKVQPAGRRSKFDKKSMGNNRKKAPRNTSPKLKSSKWPSPGLWTSFWQGCSELERKIETLINSTHIQEGYDCLTSAISDNNNILRAVKVSAPLPRGVTAPVSVSEQKIQIIILILKRGPCLFQICQPNFLTWLMFSRFCTYIRYCFRLPQQCIKTLGTRSRTRTKAKQWCKQWVTPIMNRNIKKIVIPDTIKLLQLQH